jgi:hypothetical protein
MLQLLTDYVRILMIAPSHARDRRALLEAGMVVSKTAQGSGDPLEGLERPSAR